MVALGKQLEIEARNAAVVQEVRPQRVAELFRRFRDTRDGSARDALLAVHLPLLRSMVRSYPQFLGREDMLQEAQIGFLRALETFDPDRGVTLATYARYWIRAHLNRYLLRTWSVVPRYTTYEKRRVFFGAGKARRELGVDGTDEASVRKVARRLRVSPQVVAEVEGTRGLRDEGLGEGEDGHERFASHTPLPEDEAATEERNQMIRQRLPGALAQLDDRERLIFLSRMDPDEALPLEALGERLGVSRERARQLELRARRKLAQAFSDLVDADVAAQALVAPPPRNRRARAMMA